MTIRRSKRPQRPVAVGRPRKLGAPPSSIGGPSAAIELFRAADLQDLAKATSSAQVSGNMGSEVVEAINEAFSNYANAAMMQVDDSPAAERRDWCASLARAAAELHRGLGHTEQSLFMEASAFDAAETLRKGWPTDTRAPGEQALLEWLGSSLAFALPDRHALAKGQGSAASFDDGFWTLLGRLGPALRALSLVAEAAGAGWKAEVVRGKGSKELGRRYLMEKLVPAFAQLFGQLPTSAPGSTGFRWFSALVTKAGHLAGEQRRLCCAATREEEQARIAALEAIEALAQHITPPPYRTETKGSAKLDHWIREGIAASGMRQSGKVLGAAPAPSRERSGKTRE